MDLARKTKDQLISELNYLRSIVASKDFEKPFKKEEDRFEMAFLKNSTPMAITNIENGRYIDVNEAFSAIMGIKREDIIGNTSTGLGYITVEQRTIFLNEFNAKGYVENLEMPTKTKNGELKYGIFNSSSIKIGGRDYLLTVVTDITKRKKAEEEKQILEERLRQAEKMEALGTLAGGVAHDLNNVLGIIVGYSELLMMNASLPRLLKPQLETIMKGGQRAAAIVDDLLTLARRGVSNRQIINLNKVVADIQQLPEFTKLLFYHPLVTFKVDIESDLLNISGSSMHLSKTLFNLILNAYEAMPNSGIVTVKTANQYLDKPIQGYDEVREGDYVVLSVSDTGEGISAVDLKRIFEPFYTRKVMGKSGTGLGLTVVWGTVKDHEGYIDIQSEKGKGSTFTLYFPVARKEIISETVAAAISKYMGNGETILVVDDVREQRELAAAMLSRLNYKVCTVGSGEEAIDYIKENSNIDLLVLDMIMDPGMDGLDTYRAILEFQSEQKAIIVSGFSETERVKEAHSLGAGGYIRKPYVLEKLGMAVRQEIDRKK